MLVSALPESRFFAECKPAADRGGLKLWIFRPLKYRDFYVFSHNDTWHAQKNFVCATRARRRTSLVHSLWISRACTMLNGCPAQSYRGQDAMSDKESAWQLNPRVIGKTWDSLGMSFLAYDLAHVTGLWAAAKLFQPPRLLECALVGYYLLLLQAMQAREKGGACWEQLTWAKVTLRNGLYLCGHMVHRFMDHPSSAPFEPQKTTEDISELHFARVKNTIGHSLPTLKAGLFSTQRLHYRQRQKGLEVPETRTWTGMQDDAIRAAGCRALKAATTLHAVLGINVSPADVEKELTKWFQSEGCQMLLRATPAEDEEDEDKWADEVSENEEELHQSKLLASADAGTDDAHKLHGIRMLEREAVLKSSLDSLADGQDDVQPETTEAVQIPSPKNPVKASSDRCPATLFEILETCTETVCK